MEERSNPSGNEDIHGGAGDGGWQTVKNRKKGRNKKSNAVTSTYTSEILSDNASNNHDVFTSEEEKNGPKVDAQTSDPSLSYADNNHGPGDGGMVKKKEKSRKKPITLTPAQAAARIDTAHLSAFLAEITASYASQEDIQLTKFADYFGQAFSVVSAAHFPWLKLFSDSSIDEIVDVPFCHIPKDVYRISADWIDKHSDDGLNSFVIWLLNSILSDIAMQKSLSKGPHKGAQNTSSKSQVAMFLVLSILLRRRPGVLINFLTLLKDDPKYQGRDKLALFSWMIAQAAEGDITVGLYLWTRHMLPLMGGKSGSNPKRRDLVLQVVERIISSPNARKVLSKGATRNGERLIPTSALELLLRLSFPVQSARVKATERFEVIYATLIYVALYGSPRGEELKQLSLEMLPLVLKLAGEEIPDLSQEAGKLFIWCLIQTPDCYNHWGKMYMNNMRASVVILGRLSRTWKIVSPKLSDLSTLRITLKGFREKNKKACGGEGVDATHLAVVKEADEQCRELLKMIFSERYRWMAIILFCIIWIAIGVAIFYYWF